MASTARAGDGVEGGSCSGESGRYYDAVPVPMPMPTTATARPRAPRPRAPRPRARSRREAVPREGLRGADRGGSGSESEGGESVLTAAEEKTVVEWIWDGCRRSQIIVFADGLLRSRSTPTTITLGRSLHMHFAISLWYHCGKNSRKLTIQHRGKFISSLKSQICQPFVTTNALENF